MGVDVGMGMDVGMPGEQGLDALETVWLRRLDGRYQLGVQRRYSACAEACV